MKPKDSGGKTLGESVASASISHPGMSVPHPDVPPAEPAADPAPAEEICCPACTMVNPVSSQTCEACDYSLINVPGHRSED